VDTSHLYEHTKKEIEAYFPLLNEHGIICFHDTNIYKGPLFNLRGNIVGHGWDNERGVIRAIEEYFNTTIDENKEQLYILDKVIIEHKPWSGGFTVVYKR
jgi:hypothetical protein